MKILIMILLISLAFASMTSAENAKMGGYNVSFNMSQPHKAEVISNETTSSLEIKTVDGKVDIAMIEYNMTMNIWPTPMSDLIETIKIDHKDGLIAFDSSHKYIAYYPVEKDIMAYIESTMPFYDTADFLRSLHIEKEMI